jgi:23S rRNA pseudouridine2605 synthase
MVARSTAHRAIIMPPHSKRHDRRPRYGGKPRTRSPQSSGEGNLVRLQKVLAAAGVASRRQCEELILEGRVDVDGQTVTELGTRVDPATQKIRVDGQALRRPKRLYFAINKPAGVLSTSNDPSGRPRVIDLAPTHERLYTIGRLDKSSSGLILTTNDGRLTDLLTHPRYGVEKTYLAIIAGVPSSDSLARLKRGVHFAEGFAHAKEVRVRRSHKQSTLLEIVLDEGRNREVRRLLAKIGHKVLKLQRIAIGPLRLGNLQPGESRPLSHDEVEQLYEAAQQKRKPRAKGEAKPAAKVSSSGPTSVHPIIDLSIPDESEAGIWPDQADLGAEAAADTESVPATFADEPAAVDLSPFVRGRSQHARRPTVIGGDQPKSKERNHRGRHPRENERGKRRRR